MSDGTLCWQNIYDFAVKRTTECIEANNGTKWTLSDNSEYYKGITVNYEDGSQLIFNIKLVYLSLTFNKAAKLFELSSERSKLCKIWRQGHNNPVNHSLPFSGTVIILYKIPS